MNLAFCMIQLHNTENGESMALTEKNSASVLS